ncbi:MAG TPA: hypothetical protein VNA28_11545 [Solirubrobacteraceae bacterium]|nr:hypothetical protein [Solirubrobacteraceae bacterium]
MRCSRGQATVDYVALLAVVAVLVTVAGGVAAAGGAGVVNAVTGQIRHALCVVGGGFCLDLTSRPCPVATRRDTHHYAVSLIVVRVDRDRYVLREQMSDGTVRLTVARSGALGVEAGAGGRANVSFRGRTIGLSDEARLGVQGVLGAGRVYVARDAREAVAFMRAIGAGDDPPVAAREVFYEGGIRGLATVGVGNSVAGTSLRGLGGALVNGRRDERTGDVTLGINVGGSGWGALTIALGGPLATEERAVTLGLTLDRHRRATELSLSAAGTLTGGMALPPGLTRAFGGRVNALSAEGGGRRFEFGARLDLRDPHVAAAWERFRDDPAGEEAIRGLGEAIRDRAHLDLRTYRTSSTSSGASAGIAQLVQAGGEYDHTVENARLRSAVSRPAGGLWEKRSDCVA